MELPVNFRIALSSGQTAAILADYSADRVSAFAAARFAYRFFFRQFGIVVRLLLLPIIAAGLVLYACLDSYLAELLRFLASPNPRVATLALGVLAAGIFLPLFFYAAVVAAASNLALGKKAKNARLNFKIERQEWRLYAAYLRFLLLLCVVFVSVYLLAAYVAPLFPGTAALSPWIFAFLCATAVFWLTARIGFLIAPVVAAGEGPVLRKAWRQSSPDLWRNCTLIVLLLIPGLLVQIAGEYALRIGAGAPRVSGNLSLPEYARLVGQMLGGFLAVLSVSLLVTIALLTFGALAAYHRHRLQHSV
jgi:hypothetical protein